MWKRRRDDKVRARADELTLECELLLAGRYAPLLRSQGGEVPPWAWAGVLAHASDEDLLAWAAPEVSREGDEQSGGAAWLEAVAFLADNIRRYVRTSGVTLDELQRTTLVPLELQLMDKGGPPAIRPGQLVGLVLTAVHHYPSRSQQ